MKIFQHDLQVTETNSATGSDEIDVQVPANYKGAKKDKKIIIKEQKRIKT